MWLAQGRGAHAQAPAQVPQPYPAPQPAQAYPQQAYPPPQQQYPQQQAYPQQYPQQQAYPQQYPQQQVYPPPYAAQPYQPQQPARPRRPRVKRGMLAAGISVLSASYGIALISGAILVDAECCSEVGAMMMIPVAGPYVAASVAEDGKGLLVLLGTIEVVGLGLLIGGIVRYTSSKHAAEEQGYYSLRLPHERSLGLTLNASPASLGPQLKLRF